MELLAIFLLPLGLGYILTNLVLRRTVLDFFLAFPVGHGLGMGFLMQWMLFLGIFKIPYGLFSIGLPLIIFLLSLTALYLKTVSAKKWPIEGSPPLVPSFDNFRKEKEEGVLANVCCIILLSYIIYQVIFVSWRALNFTVYTWDAIWYIARKAKFIFFERSLEHIGHLPWPSYPLQVPFSEAWVAFNIGRWDDQLIKIIFPVNFLAFL